MTIYNFDPNIGHDYLLPLNIDDPGMMNPDGYLTPDALLAYCETRMSGLDKQMQDIFAKQQQANAQISQLNNLAALYGQYAAGLNLTDGNGHPMGTQMSQSDFDSQLVTPLQQMIDSPDTSPQLRAKLQDIMNTLTTNCAGGTDDVVSADEFTSIQTCLKNAASDLNAGAELNMIQLQSIMSQRQTAIQLTTNLVQSLGDQMNKIADNIGK